MWVWVLWWAASPLDVLGEGFLAGVQFATEGARVLLLLEGRVAAVLLLVEGQVGLGGVALQTDVALERLLARVHPGVALVLPCKTARRFTNHFCVRKKRRELEKSKPGGSHLRGRSFCRIWGT